MVSVQTAPIFWRSPEHIRIGKAEKKKKAGCFAGPLKWMNRSALKFTFL